MVTTLLAFVSTGSPAVLLAADRTALVLGGTTIPTPSDFDIGVVQNQYVAPTHPGETIDYVAVTTPEELWPVTGLLRLVGFALGPPSVFGPGGSAWPDEPWWKLSGIVDLTLDQSVQAGVTSLQSAMAARGNDHLVIYAYSQGSIVATVVKRQLAEQYPEGTTAPDIDFVLGGTPNLPNGGLLSRFPGLYLPILDWTFNGAAPTDTQFDTVVYNRQYDAMADFPLYPINVIADLNALLGFVYVHPWGNDMSLAPDPSAYYQGSYGDTDYYFSETPDLPLFGPLRTAGVPEPLIDVVEPVFRVIVELGYDRSIPPWEPTPARLIPMPDPVTVASDLIDAVGEGIGNARVLTDPVAPVAVRPVAPVEAARTDPLPSLTQHQTEPRKRSNTPATQRNSTSDGTRKATSQPDRDKAPKSSGNQSGHKATKAENSTKRSGNQPATQHS